MESNERWGIVGHKWAVDALEHAIRTERAAHAFLFTGPHSIGKTTLARALAARLLCMENDKGGGAGQVVWHELRQGTPVRRMSRLHQEYQGRAS